MIEFIRPEIALPDIARALYLRTIFAPRVDIERAEFFVFRAQGYRAVDALTRARRATLTHLTHVGRTAAGRTYGCGCGVCQRAIETRSRRQQHEAR